MRTARIENQGLRVYVQRLMMLLLTVSVVAVQTGLAANASSCEMPQLQSVVLAQGIHCSCGHCDASGPDIDTDCDMVMDAEGEATAADWSPDQSGVEMSSSVGASSIEFSRSIGGDSTDLTSVAGGSSGNSGQGEGSPCQCSFRSQSEPSRPVLTAQSDPVPAEAVDADSVGSEHFRSSSSDRPHTGLARNSSRIALYVMDSSFLI